MIPVNQLNVLNKSLDILSEFAARQSIRGRFVSLYLGLRRMRAGNYGILAELGSEEFTVARDIEQFLDRLFTKSHRPEPFVVLTAPFGGSISMEAPYGARSGTTVPGREYPVNTWRNNFGIQKGVGCAAEWNVIESLLNDQQHRLACPHIDQDPEGRHICTIRDTVYRGEEHAIWLRYSDEGYQVVNLDHESVFRDYLIANGNYLPIFPLIGMLYSMAAPDVFPDRAEVGIPEFATDFGFTHAQVSDLFDCDPGSAFNSAIATMVDDTRIGEVRPFAILDRDDRVPDEPPDATLNTGVGAEIAVARDLEACGWTVRYRANQPGLGYDLEAIRDEQTLRVEVKSSIAFANLELRESEWRAALEYGDEYILAVVDFFGTVERRIWYVRDPATNAAPIERATLTYRFVRADVEPVRTDVEFL